MKNIWIILLIPLVANSDTTGNLITNGTFDNGTTGWTLSGDAQRISDCCPGGHDLEFGDSGSIEQTFDLINTHITQPMLDNGITLNSTVEIQNGECGVQGCWGGSGPADKTIVRLQILDENSNVLATTTQERYDVTGINGEDFTDSVSYTGTGSNMGNIYIFGSDSNSPASLGGPNVDNISVTMTYDPIVLTTAQTSQISTAVEEVEEIEEYKFEEIKFEEIKFEEVKIEEYKEPEFSIVKFFEEEIVTGVVNIFEEIKYEEPKTIETFTTEVESFEEIVEESESTNIENVAEAETTSESTGATETNTETNTNVGSGEEIVDENNVGEDVPVVSVAQIQEEISSRVTSVDEILIATNQAVANIMSQGRKLDSYSNKNENIFKNQLVINGGDYVETRNYFDDRDIYAQVTYNNDDPVKKYQDRIQETTDARIRAEEHLRRIRGY